MSEFEKILLTLNENLCFFSTLPGSRQRDPRETVDSRVDGEANRRVPIRVPRPDPLRRGSLLRHRGSHGGGQRHVSVQPRLVRQPVLRVTG